MTLHWCVFASPALFFLSFLLSFYRNFTVITRAVPPLKLGPDWRGRGIDRGFGGWLFLRVD